MSLTMGANGSSDGEFTRPKLALILPRIEVLGAIIIYLFHTLAYLN